MTDPFDALAKRAEITLHVEQDDRPVRGNAMASGDDAFDRQVEDEILAELDSGNVWAWATVTVRASWRGLTAEASLGCCSYSSEEEFRAGGYFDDLVFDARSELAYQIRAIAVDLDLERLGEAR